MRSNFARVLFASRRISVSISGKAVSSRAIVRRRSEVWYIQIKFSSSTLKFMRQTSISCCLLRAAALFGILTAKVLVNGLMKAGYDVKMSEVHGMSQRGGSVSTQVHWGEKVHSPVIGKGAADIIVAFEKMEAVRYADYLKPDGVAVINDYEIASSSIAAGLCEYPDGCLEAMQQHFRCHVLKAGEIAEQLGNAKCMNIVLFGSMAKALGMDDIDWEAVIAETVPPKFRELNLRAYRAGHDAVQL